MKEFSVIAKGLYCIIVFLFCGLITIVSTKHETFPIYQYGFGLDNAGNLYIGSTYDIFVYNSSGEKINQFPAVYIKYLMTVYNEKIFIKGTEHYIVLDLQGNILDEIRIDSKEAKAIPEIYRYKFYSNDGSRYELKNILFRAKIYQLDNNAKEIVWKLPITQFVPKVIYYIVIASGILSTISLMFQLGIIDKSKIIRRL
ncbi:MAG: hypothetical protein IJD81_02700 [Oscillospiraceae bacterium]|nr:hypothetical protein [Oscillospiraceae bacterium]